MTITTPQEFAVRRRAQWLMIAVGKRALGLKAQRIAGKLFKAGNSVERASREAAAITHRHHHYTGPATA